MIDNIDIKIWIFKKYGFLKTMYHKEELDVQIIVSNEFRFKLNNRVTKRKGSSWTGKIVGFYSTELTPIGYCVESETEKGSVQIYPESALTIKE